MGWVIMKFADHAQKALSQGELQTVQTGHIRAIPFVRRSLHEREEKIDEQSAEDGEREDLDFDKPCRVRWSDAF